MPLYKFQDPLSGKVITLEGDSPPTEAELEQVFAAQSGLSGGNEVTPQSNTMSQNLQQNPVSNFLLGNSLRISQDASSGINANMTEGVRTKRNKEAFEQAKRLEEAAAVTQDPMIKKKLLSQANDIYSQVSRAEQEVSQSFSPAIQDNPLLRGAASGLEIGSLAETLYRAPGAVKALGRGAKAVAHPFRAVNAIREKAIKEAGDKVVDGNKIIERLAKGAESMPPSEINQYNGFLQTATDQLKNKKLPMDTAVHMLSRANDAYKASGGLKESAKAAFEKVTGDAIKSQLPRDVLKANQLFHKLYGVQGFAKKVFSPYTIGSGLVASGAYAALNKVLGK